MAENDTAKSWWTTLPGIITAIAALITATGGLILALDKVGVFRPTAPAAPPSGLHDASKPEGTAPLADASKYEMATIEKYGYAFPYPKDLLLPVTSSVGIGRKFKAPDGRASMNLMMVENTEHSTPASALNDVLNSLATQPDVKILDRAVSATSCTLLWKKESKITFMKVAFSGNYFRMLTIEYEESVKTVYEGVTAFVGSAIER